MKLTFLKNIQKNLHEKIAMTRRVEVLSREISHILPDNCTVLDIGCGSGEISEQILIKRNNVRISGIDLLPRSDAKIPVQAFDGRQIPFDNNSFDYALIVDVLHHTTDPFILLNEAVRVCKKGIVLKDHNCNSVLQRLIMTVTDTLGNWHHDVPLQFKFLSTEEWRALFKRLDLKVINYRIDFGLYPKSRGFIFAKDMDFIACLQRAD